MSLLKEWGLTPEDDMFHPRDPNDPWWTKTVWYAFFVPERKLVGYVYLARHEILANPSAATNRRHRRHRRRSP